MTTGEPTFHVTMNPRRAKVLPLHIAAQLELDLDHDYGAIMVEVPPPLNRITYVVTDLDWFASFITAPASVIRNIEVPWSMIDRWVWGWPEDDYFAQTPPVF